MLWPGARASAAPDEPQNDDPTYLAGTTAMNEGRWSDAVTSFDKVVGARSSRADAALYWKAYSLNKLGKGELAVATCAQLRSQFRGSSWNRDCGALNVQRIRATPPGGTDGSGAPVPPYYFDFPNTGGGGTGKDPDQEMRMMALNSLLNHDPGRAVPVLRSLLTGTQPAELKKRALFVLAQSHSAEADALMHDLVTGKFGPELQYQAVQDAGVFEGRRDAPMLMEVYRGTGDLKLKRAVISALFIMGDDAHMVELARGEKDLGLKKTIVSQLSLMNGKAAADYMLELLR